MSDGHHDKSTMKEALGARTLQEVTNKLVREISDELAKLRHIHNWQAEDVIKYAAHRVADFSEGFMVEIFSTCGLKEMEARYGVAGLLMRSDWLERKGHNPDCYFMPRPKREEYEEWLKQARGVEPEPEKVHISKTLRQLVSKISDAGERTFYEETLLCLQAKAYRSAIVMGWNLAYGHMTQWIFAEAGRLKKFNDELTTRWVNKRKNIKYAEIVEEGPILFGRLNRLQPDQVMSARRG